MSEPEEKTTAPVIHAAPKTGKGVKAAFFSLPAGSHEQIDMQKAFAVPARRPSMTLNENTDAAGHMDRSYEPEEKTSIPAGYTGVNQDIGFSPSRGLNSYARHDLAALRRAIEYASRAVPIEIPTVVWDEENKNPDDFLKRFRAKVKFEFNPEDYAPSPVTSEEHANERKEYSYDLAAIEQAEANLKKYMRELNEEYKKQAVGFGHFQKIITKEFQSVGFEPLKPVDSRPSLYAREYPEAPFQAPAIACAGTEESLIPLVSYIASLRRNAETVAHKEAQRLESYFLSSSSYLTLALQARRDNCGYGHEINDYSKTKRLEGICQPGALAGLFEVVAGHARNTILSEAVIVPENALKDKNLSQRVFEDCEQYNPSYKYRNQSFTFGFIQAFQRDGTGIDRRRRISSFASLLDPSPAIAVDAVRSVSFPILGLDTPVLQALESRKPEKLLRDLQKAVTWMNHDMLHHYSSYIITEKIARKFSSDFNAVSTWGMAFDSFGDQNPNGYETWSILTHARMKSFSGFDDIRHTLDSYFDELDRIAEDMRQDILAKQDNPELAGEQRRKAHEIIDYFGILMGFAIMRVVPFGHPLMERYCERMERADLAPELTEKELAKEFGIESIADFRRDDIKKYASVAPSLKDNPYFKLGLMAKNPFEEKFAQAIDNYLAQDAAFLPQDGQAFSYRQIRTLQLMLFDPRVALLHSPHQGVQNDFKRAINAADTRMLGMLDVVAQTVNFQPEKVAPAPAVA